MEPFVRAVEIVLTEQPLPALLPGVYVAGIPLRGAPIRDLAALPIHMSVLEPNAAPVGTKLPTISMRSFSIHRIAARSADAAMATPASA